MSLKHKLIKAEYDALSDALKALYKAVGDDFELDVEDGELRRAHEREKQQARDEKARADKAEKDLRDLRETTAHNSGDIVAIEKSWKEKLDAAETAGKTQAKQLQKQLQAVLVDKEAIAIAAELGGDAADLLLPHITKRLKAELDGEVAVTRVLDKDGKASALTLAELKKEIAEDKRFSPIIIASKASGGGAAGGNRQPNGGAGSGSQDKKFNELTAQERTDWLKRDPKGFNEASEANKREILKSRTHVQRIA